MFSLISRFILYLSGWSVEGYHPGNLQKCIYVVMPHTSNWDFIIGVLVRSALKLRVNYVGKNSLFKPPWGFIFRALGGHPVDRSKSTRMVDAIVLLYQQNDRFAIAITPEGTRTKVGQLKTGFYHIARLAGIPMILTKIDGERKEVVFSMPFYPTDDQNEDLKYIYNYFEGVRGINPENSFSP